MKKGWIWVVLLAALVTTVPAGAQTAPVLQYLGFSPGMPPADKLECRQAIAYALDREAIVAAIRQVRPTAKPALTIQPPLLPGYDSAAAQYAYDPAKSKELFGRCGAAGLTIKTGPRSDDFLRIYYPAVEESLRRTLGVPVTVETFGSPTALAGDVRAGGIAIYLRSWSADPQDYGYPSFAIGIARFGARVYGPEIASLVVKRDASGVERLLLEKALIIPVIYY